MRRNRFLPEVTAKHFTINLSGTRLLPLIIMRPFHAGMCPFFKPRFCSHCGFRRRQINSLFCILSRRCLEGATVHYSHPIVRLIWSARETPLSDARLVVKTVNTVNHITSSSDVLLNLTFKLSPTWSCVSLPRPPTASGSKLLIFV